MARLIVTPGPSPARLATGGPPPPRGFTLIEVLVAISVMALMSLMAWRGLDGMLRTQSSLQSRSDEIRTLQAGLAQWQTDLDQLAELPGTPSWGWDGRVLRLTRRTAEAPATAPQTMALPSVRVVAWTWRSDPGRPGGGDWQRWQSAPLTQRQDWQTAWALAQQWGQTPDDNTRAGHIQIHPLSGWQLFVHRGGSWTHPLSSDAVTSGPPAPGNEAPSQTQSGTTPDGVRLMLTLPPGPAGSGTLSLDWVRPTLSGTPS
ncbi:general secretion pathway protein GspJ [Limnohabitans sp. 2KL-1]|jgi:general secretion pathway protein J|uniref:PulJ/GspJ family protein n=1 Tax=Limnohabitans sp. 2KL-1 TaxID=1100699 RepID=UPI000D38551B|nr:prepilin-type N-terminal cleavage/methylation domain-containing protein [Limnohabitans sp. 2KL-1]PUE50704.1 general secretion pathway protein GspJ [Limnohabitans sp. 2KL-1]